VEENSLNSPAFAKAALDSVSANICIIDKTGIILAVNQRWRDFFQENSEDRESKSIGINYLDICNSASGSRSEEALPMYEGIMSVIQARSTAIFLRIISI
jgi:PAS domain-containing protein